jgi:hypothetical protein
MRRYVSGQLSGLNVDHLSTDHLVRMIDASYVGGIDAWSVDYLGRPRTSTEDTQIALRARYRDITGRVLPTHHTIISMRSDDVTGRVSIAVSIDHGRDSATRQTITARTLRLTVHEGWAEVDRLEMPDPDFAPETTVGQYTAVMTPERYAEAVDQYLTCYRPGSDAAPMDGCYGPTRKDTLRSERRAHETFMRSVEMGV